MSKVIIACAGKGAIRIPSLSLYLSVTPTEIIEASVRQPSSGCTPATR